MRHISVPHYENLTIDKIKAFSIGQNKDIEKYLPDKRELFKVSREWIANVCATVLGTAFTDWVKEQIEERNEAVKEKGERMDCSIGEKEKKNIVVGIESAVDVNFLLAIARCV